MYQPRWFSTFSCEFLWFSFRASVAKTVHTNTKWYLQEGRGFQITSQVFLVKKSNVEAIDYAWILVFFSWKLELLEKMWYGYISFVTDDIGSCGWKSPLKNKYVKGKLVFSISFANKKNWNRTNCWCSRHYAVVFQVYSKIGW